ncbi:MAG: DUF4240 domain-containing protein [bacterium]|nr:DUF4240 domain-containing protein [bacterium]
MNDFWDFVKTRREATKDNPDQFAERLIDELVSLGLQQVLDFFQWFESLLDRANTYELWDAVDIIECGASESTFLDFREWLILQSQEVYEKALADPEWLADYVQLDTIFTDQGLGGVAYYAYERIMGHYMHPTLQGINTGVKGVKMPYTDETRDAVLKARHPKLYAKFGNCERWGLDQEEVQE